MISALVFFLPLAFVAGDLNNNIFLAPLLNNNSNNVDRFEHPVCEKGGTYSLPHKHFCDKFYTCKDGIPIEEECLDGLGYIPHIGCKPLHVVDCATRPMLQAPKGRGNCPRLYGIFNNPKGCGQYFRCENGFATEGVCPQKYMFDDRRKQCRKPLKWELMMCFPQGSHHGQTQQHHEHPYPYPKPTVHEEEQGLNHFLSGFKCPDISMMHLPFGQHSRHPYPGNCRYFIMCLKDGTMKISGCELGMAFSPVTGVCEAEHLVQNCRKQ